VCNPDVWWAESAGWHAVGFASACSPKAESMPPAVKGLTNLQHLDLDRTQITDAGLAELKELQNQQTLYLSYAEKITGTGFAALTLRI
jgi:Leucine-rich repeat (LRR) protein